MEEQPVDVDFLFKAHSIIEIKDAEKKLRGEIEKKKEDLRVMVGERYRDLINAADTINQMKNLTQEVHSGISSIQKCCGNFRNRTPNRQRTISEDIKLGNKETNFYALATQMELLVDTPEKIWDALDKRKYLNAAQLYLLGHHIVNNSLPINTGYQNQGDVFASFPILHHQWAAISHFKDSILKGSSAALKDATLPDQILTESLCSIILLNDSSPRQIFMQFLLARKAAIQDIFRARQHKMSIKRQISDITSLILLTLQQIYSLFYCPESNISLDKSDSQALLYKTIHNVTKKKQTDQGEPLQWLFGEDFDILTVARHLPPIVSGFRPKLRNGILIVPLQTIQTNTKEWLAGCISDVHEEVEKLLVYIKNIKGLASIRDTVYDLLKNSRLFGGGVDEKIPLEHSVQQARNWKELCDVVLSKDLIIWDEFFQPLFIQRAKAVLNTMFADAGSTLLQSIDETVDRLKDTLTSSDSDLKWDRDITSFLWHELPGDLPTSGWSVESSNGDSDEVSSLTLKVKGCTLSVKSLCDFLNKKLGEVFQNAKYLLEDEAADDHEKSRKEFKRSLTFEEDLRTEPFKKLASASEIQKFLQKSSLQLVKNICCHVQDSRDALKKKLVDEETEDESITSLILDRITFLGRVCKAVPEYCTNLMCLACGNQEEAKSILNQRTSKYGQRRTKQPKVGPASVYEETTELFMEQHRISFGIWKDWVANQLIILLDKTLHSAEDLTVFGTMCWEDVSIEEEGDAGNKVQSKIRVPAQVSSFVISLLFRLSEEINRIGGHVLERSLIKQLTLQIGNGFLDSYEQFVRESEEVRQNRSLQFMFDIRFLTLLIGGNTETTDQAANEFKKRSKSLVDMLEKFVDPFDLDVFTPHMTTFINRQLQRSWLLLGTLSNLDKYSLPPLTHRSSSTTQEQHNVVPLAPNPVRFMLLPISSQQQKTNQFKTEDLDLSQSKEKNKNLTFKSPLFTHLDYFTLDYF